MNNQTIIEQYKDYANCIVGTWHNEKPGLVLIFHLLENLAQEAAVDTENDNIKSTASYTIYMDADDHWYLQTWDTQGRKKAKYCILVLSPNVMALANEYNELSIYMRKVDYSFVYSVIDKL